MRLIWVKVGGLWPVNTGGRIRSFHMLRELSRRHHVTLLTTHGPSEDPRALETALPRCEVVSVPWALAKRGTARFALALIRSWLSSLPVDLYKARVPALGREVERRLASGGVDLVVADFLLAAPNLTRAAAPPTVLFAHNVEHVIWERMREVERRAWRRALLALESRKMRRYEALTCARARLTIAVSDADRRLLAAAAPRARVSAVPTGVDVDYFTPDGVAETAVMVQGTSRGPPIFSNDMTLVTLNACTRTAIQCRAHLEVIEPPPWVRIRTMGPGTSVAQPLWSELVGAGAGGAATGVIGSAARLSPPPTAQPSIHPP